MQNRIIATVAFLVFCASVHARSDTTWHRKSGYYISLHSGCLAGKTGEGTFFTSSLLQGWRFDRMAMGLGVGYDAYSDWRVMPFFLSVSYDLVRFTDDAFFLQVNGGLAKSWIPAAGFEIEDDERAAFNISPLAGYRIGGDKFNLYLSVGYKFQTLKYSWAWSQGGNRTFVSREIGRVCIQLGVGLR